eukprot:COSAG02_NODE_2912_length_7764_cov_2.843575_2_plen_60_part_00
MCNAHGSGGRGGKDQKWTFLGRTDYSGTSRLPVLRPLSFEGTTAADASSEGFSVEFPSA